MEIRKALVQRLWNLRERLAADRFVPSYDVRSYSPEETRLSDCFPLKPSFLATADVAIRREGQRWVDLAISEVHDITTRGLPVYHILAPALRPGFPWHGRWYRGRSDVLFPARPHRFAFAPRLALAIFGGGYKHRDFTALLEDWMRSSRRQPTLPFISTFVVLQRLLALTCAKSFLRVTPDGDEEDSEALERAIGLVLREDINYLLPRIGRSYPNGHLLADRFAAWFIVTAYPSQAKRFASSDELESIWLQELERQTYADGGGFEHAIHYHGLATEMAITYLLLKRASGDHVAAHYEQRIRSMTRFQSDLAGTDGNAPMLGDAIEDPMLPLDGGVGTTAAAMRSIYSSLFDPAVPPPIDRHPGNERNFWLSANAPSTSRVPVKVRGFSALHESGVFVFFDDDEATRCVFRTGPSAATQTMAGHMHADLLSVCLVYKRVPVIVDPGTYSYRSGTVGREGDESVDWREYFSGPGAHNGIVRAGVDPLGAVTGDFRSGHGAAAVAHTSICAGKDLSVVEARIDAPASYSSYVRGVIHVRGEYFLIYTMSDGSRGTEGVHLPLQLNEGIEIQSETKNSLIASMSNEAGFPIVYSDEMTLSERRCGELNPPGGWVSSSYGRKRPALQLLFRPESDDVIGSFIFGLQMPLRISRIVSERASTTSMFRIEASDYCDYVISSTMPSTPLHWEGIDFQGRLLWLRVHSSGESDLRALDVTECSVAGHNIEVRNDGVLGELRQHSSPANVRSI